MDVSITKTKEELCDIVQQPANVSREQTGETCAVSKQELNDAVLETNEISVNGSNDSEYESVDSENSSSDREDNIRMRGPQSEHEVDECDLESEGSVILEREEGDGQESLPTKKVDDDEDKKNPQYIPKRGTFYEHDDRTLDEIDKQENLEKNEKQTKKTVWMEKKEKWSHDRYNDNEQAPKSRAELVSIYGYDIRNEDGPPRARRRRRYGRGPNKYTRTWDDEDAYKPTKPIKTSLKKPKKRDEDEYPPLANRNNREHENNQSEDNSDDKHEDLTENYDTKITSANSDVTNDVSTSKHEVPNRKLSNSSLSDQPNTRPQQQRVGTGRIIKPKSEIKKEIKDSDYKGFTKTRQFRNSKSEQKILPRTAKNQINDNIPSEVNAQTKIQNIERDLNKMNIQDNIPKANTKPVNQRQASVPPRLQGEQKGSKRYSSLRQRSLPETTTAFNQSSFYPSEYNQQPQPSQQQPLLPQPNALHATSVQVPQIAPPPIPSLSQQVPVTATPILQAPQFASPFPQPPTAYLSPPVPPPPFLPQQPPAIINYVQGQPQFPQPSPFQGYQHQQFNTVNQPAAELYQCQGGTTYYSTQNQHITKRAAPQKRPKAAIPIVPPPPQAPKGRGRLAHQRETPPVGEENIEFIIDNEINSNVLEDPLIVQQ